MRASILVILTIAVACADKRDHVEAPPDPSTSLDNLLGDEGSVAGSAGLSEGRGNDIARVIDAQFSRSDSTVWVVDNVAPYVRRFTPTGQQLARYVSRGDGPTEARGVGSIAVKDSLFGIVHSGLISVYRYNGEPVATHVRLPFIAERIGAGCEGEWLVSGRSNLDNVRTRSGLYAVRLLPDGIPEVRRLETDTSATPLHGPRRVHSAGGRVTVLNVRRDPRTISVATCPFDSLRHAVTMPPENVVETWRGSGSRRTITVQHQDDSRRVTGFAADGEGIFVSFITADGSSIAYYDGEQLRAEVASEHHYTVLDALDSFVLIRRTEPVPGVVWLQASQLLRLMALSTCGQDQRAHGLDRHANTLEAEVPADCG